MAVIFFDNSNNPLEQFMFKLTMDESYGPKVEEVDLEFSLRSFLIKLPATEPLTRVLPQSKSQVHSQFSSSVSCFNVVFLS